MVPDQEKDEDYHKQYVQAVVNRSVNYNFDLNYAMMTECYKYYDGVQGGEEWKFLQEAEDGSILPATWINYNAIRNKVDLLVGDLSSKGYEIRAKAINRDAVSRKLAERETARVDLRLAPYAQEFQQQFGLSVGTNSEGLPADEEDLNEFFEKNYKEQSELVMEGILKYIAKDSNWDYTRIALFRDMIITGRCFARTEIIDGIPVARRIDPRLVIFDQNSENDLLTDSTYWGEVRYMDIGDAAEMYGLSMEELTEAYHGYRSYEKMHMTRTAYDSDYASLNGTELKWFKEDRGNALRVLVLTGYWRDTRDFNFKKSKDSFGEEHLRRVSSTYNVAPTSKAELIRKRIPIWRTGCLIGGKIFKNWGVVENQSTSIDNYATTHSPYFGVIPNFVNYQGISKVQQLKALQDLKNVTLYNIQLAMARAGAKGFVYDSAQVPEGWEVSTVIKYLKTVGIAFIDSKKDGVPSNFNQFGPIDMTLSDSVQQYLAINMMVDNEMNAISGVNEERQGNVASPYQTVGVTQSALFQSNLITEVLYKEFRLFVNNIFGNLAGLAKIAWAKKERFAMIIGDVGINFLKKDIELDLNDYGVYVEEAMPVLDDKRTLNAVVMAALQSGSIDFADAMKLLREEDINYSIRELERKMKENQEMQQAMAQQEQEAAMRQAQMQQAAQAEMKEDEQESKLEQIDRKGQWDQKQSLANIKKDLLSDKLDFSKALLLEKIKAQNQKRVDEGKPKAAKKKKSNKK
jgi:hypothetical protein